MPVEARHSLKIAATGFWAQTYRTEGNIAEHKGVIHLTEQLVNAIHYPRRGRQLVPGGMRAHFAAGLCAISAPRNA